MFSKILNRPALAIVVSIVILFLGGWHLWGITGVASEGNTITWFEAIIRLAVLSAKVVGVILFFMLARWSWPRFRFDQLMRLAWEGMIPTALLVLLCTAVFVYLGLAQWMWAGSLGCLLVVWFVGPRLPSTDPNAKVGLLGSRFSPA